MTLTATHDPLVAAVLALAERNQDFAQEQNGVGYNQADSHFGNGLAAIPPSRWTAENRRAAWEMLRKYRGQLAGYGIAFDSIPEPEGDSERAVLKAAYLTVRGVGPTDAPVFAMRAPYDADLVYRQKRIPGRRWDAGAKVNTFPLAARSQIVDLMADFEFYWQVDDRARAALEGREIPDEPTQAPPPPVTQAPEAGPSLRISTSGNRWVIASPYDPAVVEAMRSITGRRWNGQDKVNEVTRSALGAVELEQFIRECGPAMISREAQQWITDLTPDGRRKMEERKALADMSNAQDAQYEVAGLGGELHPFQRAGVAYVMRADQRSFIADDMGTGKTVQALALVQASQTFPAIVLCPSAVKLSWRNHVRGPARGAPQGWLPGRNVVVCQGRKPDLDLLRGADVVVINYDIVSSWVPALVQIGARALILDEAHKLKTPKAARTLAAAALKDCIPGDGLTLALTGTPVLNRPVELVQQLKILGRMGDLGGERKYGWRYCQTTDHLPELNEKLRATCWIRRTKAEVMPELPGKQIVRVPVEISEGGEYGRVLTDVVTVLKDGRAVEDEAGDVISRRKLSAMEELAELGKLRQEVGRAKLGPAISWVKEMLDGSDEKLIIFAHHREFQDAYAEALPGCARISGGMTDEKRQAEVDRFQDDPECRVIVCSLMAAREGITLTAASNVIFHEQDWTPATHDQAEDRANRMGQENAVTCWYLLADGTIDDMMADMIEEKREVTSAVTDGEARSRRATSIAGDVAKLLVKQGKRARR